MHFSRLAERLPENGLPPPKSLTVLFSIVRVTMVSGDQGIEASPASWFQTAGTSSSPTMTAAGPRRSLWYDLHRNAPTMDGPDARSGCILLFAPAQRYTCRAWTSLPRARAHRRVADINRLCLAAAGTIFPLRSFAVRRHPGGGCQGAKLCPECSLRSHEKDARGLCGSSRGSMADDLTLFPEYLRILNETGIAWHHCPGNHDMNFDAPDSRHAFETWKRFIGPTSYAFQYAGATFILLNNVEYFGCDNKLQGGRAYRGRIGNDQLRFIDNVLRNVPQNDLIVVSMHIPLQSFDNPDGAADTTIDRTALLRLLSHRPYSVSFALSYDGTPLLRRRIQFRAR